MSENLENSLIEPLSILLRLNNSSIYHNQQLRSALEVGAARLAARNCTPVDAAELQLILARLDAAEEEKTRGDLDRDLHIKIGKMAQSPMLFSVMSASAQLTENIITGIRSYMMQKQHSVSPMDEQHRKLVDAIVEHQRGRCRNLYEGTYESNRRYHIRNRSEKRKYKGLKTGVKAAA